MHTHTRSLVSPLQQRRRVKGAESVYKETIVIVSHTNLATYRGKGSKEETTDKAVGSTF